jgi:hypothetical protein
MNERKGEGAAGGAGGGVASGVGVWALERPGVATRVSKRDRARKKRARLEEDRGSEQRGIMQLLYR